MTQGTHADKASAYLRRLCSNPDGRRTGSEANRAATAWFADSISALGWETDCPEFECVDWMQAGAELSVGVERFALQASPFTLGGTVRAPLVVVSTVEELEAASLSDRVVLLRGDIAKEQLMPKNFSFYNPNEHKRIYRGLEAARPSAIVCATGRNPELAGALYPFPLIEDGDFDIPSCYITDVEGDRLARFAGREAWLSIRAQRSPAWGCNVLARRGGAAASSSRRRVVVFAHIDTKGGTPGALDNAAGVTVLLLLAELLAEYSGALGIELLAMNGEDYYAASGEKQWLRANEGRHGEIVLGINLDGVGHRGGRPAYSLYGCSPELAALIRRAFTAYPSLVEGEPWYQSDHGLFLMNGIPALAFTSQQFGELWSEVAHTPDDRPEIVDPGQLAEVAAALEELLLRLASSSEPATGSPSLR